MHSLGKSVYGTNATRRRPDCVQYRHALPLLSAFDLKITLSAGKETAALPAS
jgi:hypothetical protein